MFTEKPVSNDAYKFLSVLYEAYLARRNNAFDRDSAKEFSDEEIIKTVCDFIHPNDIASITKELKSAGYITADILGNVTLTSDTIVYMENIVPAGISKAIEIFKLLK